MAAMHTDLPAFVTPLGHDIFAVDTGFHRDHFDAAYLLRADGRAAFIDTGTHFAVPRLLAALDALGIPHDAVDYIIPTHVHLDHAGGVGTLAAALPQATVVVHPRGARHMVDPSALWEGATAVYGAAEMAASYGTVTPVAAARVQETSDGLVLSLGKRPLRFADTPGHAKHHHCIWDAASRGWFTGDTFGLSYREFDTAKGAWLIPTSTPVQFEPDALRRSVGRLLAEDPACMYLTHYSRVTDVPRLGRLFLGLLERMVALAEAQRAAPARHQALKDGLLEIYVDSLAEHGCAYDRDTVARLLAIDIELNAQGIQVWLDRS
jgi:glyoxylase-like metal-dependent hydrolase (beta-lactamase superfamily II)